MAKTFPFDAAIFDLDGTLLDSMDVWRRVDEIYFERMGMPVPEDYGRALAGKSYRESAEYTIERFHLSCSWEELVAQWTSLAQQEYACHVPMKDGAREYLLALKRSGVKLAVATALPEYLYRPCLERHGVIDWFDALCSTDDTGGRGKLSGEVFLLAAQRLGIEAEKCAVFEDVFEGISGAKRLGMRAYCVRDAASSHAHGDIERLADGMVDSFRDILPWRRCVIFTARCEGDVRKAYLDPQDDDLLLCADAGYAFARSLGLHPHAVIGDFDSSPAPEGENVLRFPVEKDDPDTLLCAKHAMELGIGSFLIVGGLGGRLDHTLANLQTLSYLAERSARAELCDGRLHAVAIRDGCVRLPRSAGKLSVFAMAGKCEGVWIRGAKYELENGVLTPDYPLGMGNDFAADEAEIGVKHGMLLAMRELEPAK